EAEASNGARVLADGVVFLLALDLGFRLVVLVLRRILVLDAVSVPAAVLGGVLDAGDQLGEHPGQGVDLMAAKLGPGGKARRVIGEHPLEPEHQGVANLPLGGGRASARLHLGERVVERVATGTSLAKGLPRIFVRPEERLTGPALSTEGGGGQAVR